MDLISIIVPCYNMEKKIKKCICSIKKQSYKNFEAILIDDGSKDKTKEIIKKNIKNDKRFKYVYKKNGGVSSARNKGIEKAKGKYICFIDSDDYVEKNYLKELYKCLIENDSDVSACYFNRIYDKKSVINRVDNEIDLLKFPAPWNKLYKTELFKKNNIKFPVGKWYEDLCVSSEILFKLNKVSIVNKPLYNYIFIQNSSSIMHTYDDRIYQVYDMVEDIEKFAKNNKLYNKHKDKIEFICVYHILVGTIYRSSFRDDFNKNTIKSITSYVEKKYPNWYKNNEIKNLPFVYKTYLKFLKFHCYNLIYIMLKLFNDKMKV